MLPPKPAKTGPAAVESFLTEADEFLRAFYGRTGAYLALYLVQSYLVSKGVSPSISGNDANANPTPCGLELDISRLILALWLME